MFGAGPRTARKPVADGGPAREPDGPAPADGTAAGPRSARPGPPAILARGLGKTYAGVEAVRGIDLTVAQGETFGFLGPNGAGKTTTISMLTTLATPTSGRIEIAGHDTRTAPQQVRRNLGLVFQETTLDPELTAVENLRFHADLYALPRAGLSERITAMLELVGLAARGGSLVRTFSGGMQRRLEIARGLLHRPRLLFLDEPTIGLDPQTRAQVWTHLAEIREREATTIFLTTHYLDEAEQCDRIAIIDDGRIVAQGSPAELKSVIGADRVDLRTGDDVAAAALLRTRFGLDPVHGPAGLSVKVAEGARLVPALCAALDVAVYEVTVTRPSLDDVFLHHTGRGIRDDSGAGA
ncbi:ATP-binding cassette domain-containing protein [Streptomyces sp. NPDC021096]|uniref:ABC transporter ATP-binding protein n=1 Tax=Streptomyces sp. NPDC021096 TaxID=3154792 RepID=UPI0033DC3416